MVLSFPQLQQLKILPLYQLPGLLLNKAHRFASGLVPEISPLLLLLLSIG